MSPQGKLNGLAVRVPLTNSSITDCVFEVSRPTTVAEVNALMKVREFVLNCVGGECEPWLKGHPLVRALPPATPLKKRF